MKSLRILLWLLLPLLHSLAQSEPVVLGFHAHDPRHIDAAAKTGYSAIRLWDAGTDWSSLKPQQDLWRFDRIDAYLLGSEKAKLKVIWTIGNTPRWASARPNESCAYGFGCAAEPKDLDDWRRYIRTIAITFRGRVECYEPWNEVSFPSDPVFSAPGSGGDPGQFFTGSVESMVNLARIAYEEIKKVDPNACVLSPSFHVSGDWVLKLDRFLAAGGGKYFDVVSQHLYFGEEPERAVRMIRELRQVLVKHQLGNVPMWNTEVGWPFEEQAKFWPGMSLQDLVYSMTLRTYLLNASEGVTRIYWYAWDNKGLGFFQAGTNFDFGSEAAAAAMRLLDGATSSKCQAKGSMWECMVTARATQFRVTWIAGRNAVPMQVVYSTNATRWGKNLETFPAGQAFLLDGRPVIVESD